MVQLTLYGDARSTCTQRILILLEELQLKYDLVKIDLSKGEQKTPEFLKMQPFGKIPVLKYDDETIFESRSIMRYLALHNDDEQLVSGTPQIDMWLEADANNFNPVISKIVYEMVFKKYHGESPDMEIVKVLLYQLKDLLQIYDNQLSDKKYLSDTFSIADISYFPYLHYFYKISDEYKQFIKRYNHVYRWYKRILNRKSVQDILTMGSE
jgi:glutathione S-transferase